MEVEAERRDETARIEETDEARSRGPGLVWSAGCARPDDDRDQIEKDLYG